jgi:hypothetical protein
MMRTIVRHIRSNLVSYLALFVALSGTGYAARDLVLPVNSVGSAQVVDRSLLRRDFKPGQLLRGRRGPQGARGSQGDAGPKGDAAGSLSLGVTTVDADAGGLDGTSAGVLAKCPPDTTVVGGGFSNPQVPGVNVFVQWSQPDDAQNGWAVVVRAESSGMPTAVPIFHAFARCARLVAP